MKNENEGRQVKQLDDRDLDRVSGGMKIVIKSRPKFIEPLLRILCKIKKNDTD